jgi:hypothetical protein
MDLDTALLVFAAVFAPIAVVCHLYLAYVVAPKRAVEATTAFFTSAEGASLVNDLFGGWIQSDEGKKVLGTIIGATGEVVKEKVVAMLTGAAGNAKLAAQNKGTELLAGAMDFGDPILNGVLAFCPPEQKKALVGRLSNLLVKATGRELDMGPTGEGTFTL